MELNTKYHLKENLFRSFWLRLLERELADKDLANHETLEAEGSEDLLRASYLYLNEFDIEIELLPEAKNKAMKLRLGSKIKPLIDKKFQEESDVVSTGSDDEFGFVTETIFTIRDVKKDTRLHAIVRAYLTKAKAKLDS